MIDGTISLGNLLACIAWAASAGLLALAWILALPYLGMIGVALSAVAGTATIRTWFVGMQHRERNAFELGRESVRSVGR